METYFIEELALLLMQRLSAREASELSKSPVSTLPGAAGAGAEPAIGQAPIKPIIFAFEPAPRLPVGRITSPSGSKPGRC